ncbi:uncharacterized protein LOC123516909 isoform X2 [Portunus trituberculatus]|uniref:uncharacterized protein LOC123516909 isoform X2 n=1 Tax=Portunus trituberculatus TaxID=210409 RepID=UPI001E1CC33C|nr:uncharacterized protein LOC123516909 isoform X2 [Portunus trituberculatus]
MMGLWVAVAAAAVGCLGHALAMPVSQEGSGGERAWSGRQYVEAGLGVAALLTSVTTLLACACCKRSRGFKVRCAHQERAERGEQELGSVSSRVAGSSSTLAQGPREEITLFPPAGLSLSTTQINFEPLPDIRPRPSALGHARPASDRTLPPFFPGRSPSSPAAAPPTPTDEWFAEPHQSFPRNQLQYVRELGQGWFGQVLEGRAAGVFSDHTKGESPVSTTVGSGGLTPVAVKVLREDASPSEQQYFLQELRPYRDLSHPNVLRVLAHCLEAEPFLILLQLCPRGDLKAVLRSDRSLSEVALLRMTLDVASGLTHMHAHHFIHTDLAARNCVVEEDNSVKIGDYGFSLNSYKDEYYCAGDVALPLRWCSPETLKCTDTTIETKEVTKAANVWSFGVVMWEIASRGDLPYHHLDHEQVIQDVIVDQTTQLDLPSNLQLHAGKLYNIMKQCWEGEESRPAMMHTHSLLAHLWEHAAATPDQDTSSLGDFEQRWNQLQQLDCRDHSIMHTGNTSSLRFESDFNLSSAMDTQPLGEAMSPSLQNLHGSAEDLDARIDARFKPLPSWLGVEPGQQIDSLTQEITDAILKLDDYLAGEKSEPSTGQTSPEKGGVNFKLGKDSFVSNPPESIATRMGGISIDDGRGHPSLTGALSEEEEGFSMKLEQGAFTEMVRLKSQSVQDFMKLTVVDDASDSDTTSQRNSLGFEPLSQEKTFSSEGNIKEALRDAKFMGDLERLQAEHRYSIITEVSRECASSIEYRNQGLNGDTFLSEYHQEDETPQGGSTDRLIIDAESEGSSNSHERLHSEQDPFLCKLISSETTEETVKKVCDAKEGKSAPSDETDNSVGVKPLPASPDCVVSSREPKPVALPDIVAHNGGSSLAHSSLSPPTSPSAFTHINSNQRKEFRFIFGNEMAEGPKSAEEDLPDGSAHVTSVVFSENIKEETAEGSLKDNSQEKSVLGSTSDEESLSNATEHVVKGNYVDSFDDRSDSDNFSLYDKHFVEGRTSTPFKVLSLTRTGVMDKDELQSECLNSEFSGSLTSSKEETADINSSQNNEVKQRLVFSTSSSEGKDTSNKGEQGKNEGLSSIKEESVPSYTPEEIVKGEEIVIGALEDYSLDLYKAVKSTEAPPVSPSSDAPAAQLPGSEDTKISAEFSGIEFDLDQWDKFLGKTLSRENSCSDPVFMEGIIGDGDVACDAVNDSVAVGFEQDILNKEDISANATSSNISDFVSPSFYTAHEGVSSTLVGSGEGTQVLSESELSLKGDRKLEHKSATPPEVTQQSSKASPLSEALTENHQSVQSEESFHTVASKVSTSPEHLHHDKTPTLVDNTTTTPSSATSAGLEEAVMEESMYSNTSWGEFPSPQFSYKKEAPVDTSFEQSGEVEPVSTKTKLKLDLAGGMLGGIPDHFSSDILDPVVHTNNSAYSVDSDNFKQEKCPENLLLNNDVDSMPMTREVINGLETERSSSDANGVSSALQFGSPSSDPHTTLIIQGEDDLSPSAYQGSWSARGDGEGALRGNELENGDFWEQQMVAWQAAAFQTRQLLQEAAGQGEEGVVQEQTKRQEEEEVSPRSDASSSSKSLYSSTDLLNLDDEGTYVSYNTTDEEEVLGYRPEDISALRAELSLKLETGQGESQQQEPEEPEDPAILDRDNVVINYRGIISSTLSPIKEESFLEEDDTPGRRGSHGNGVEGDSVLDWSIEFEEPASNDCEESKSNTFVISDSSIMQLSAPLQIEHLSGVQTGTKADDGSSQSPQECSRIAGEALGASLENTHDSLILEDLDEEDGPASIQIYNSGTNLDAEDILVVNTETNEATIVDQGKPRSHLAFVTEQEPPPEAPPLHPLGFEDTDDVAPESIPSEEGRSLQQLLRREQAASGKLSWDQTDSHGIQEDERSSESKSTTEFVITSGDAPSSSPEGIQVPAYHSYFTSALSSISHPSASLEEPPLYEQVEQISLPYEVNYPPPTALEEEEEELHSLEDVQQQQQGDGSTGGHNISEIEDDEDAAPIKLSFLGRLYSDEDKEEQHKKPKAEREATLLSDSEGEDLPNKLTVLPKTEEPSSLRHMTSAEFLASEMYKTNDAEEVEEQLTAEADSEEDSEDENSPRGSPAKGEGASPTSHESRYTPDWETDSDTDDDSSSTSGEFMWKEEEEEKDKHVEEKPGEPCQPAPYILDIIEEEPHEDEEREEGELSEDSESGEEEFTPSQWNSDLTPSHSLLKSPQNKSSLKKRVRWKRQRHHRVYEYPPEPRSWEHSLTEPQYRRSWGRSSLDYLSLADWELGADEFIADESEDIEDYVYHKPSRPAPPPPIYSLGSMTYDEAAEGFLVDNGEFFIRSSGSPFTFTRSSFSASDFFPGGHSSDYDVIFGSTAQTAGVPFSNCKVPECPPEVSEEQVTYSSKEERQLEEDLQASTLTQEESEQQGGGSGSLGQLRHTRDKLRLEIPSLTLASDSNKGSPSALENGCSGLECSEQNFVIMNHNRVEPEVSEV